MQFLRTLILALACLLLRGVECSTIAAEFVIDVEDSSWIQELDDMYLGFNIDSGAHRGKSELKNSGPELPFLQLFCSWTFVRSIRVEARRVTYYVQLAGSLYHNIDLDDEIFQQLTRNLAPAQLRVGGSASDSLWRVPITALLCHVLLTYAAALPSVECM